MKMRNFGKLGIQGSALGLGCMRFPKKEVDGKMVVDEENAINIIRTAIDGGVTYMDTAYVYLDQTSEVILGKALQDGYRERVTIATKLPTWMVEKEEDMQRFFDEELARLQTDHIDFYLVHSLSAERWSKIKPLGICQFLDRLKKEGKIRFACFSFHDDYKVFETILNDYDWDMCQIQYNFMDINNQAGTKGLELAGSKGIPVVVMEGLLGGRLAKAPEDYSVYDILCLTEGTLAPVSCLEAGQNCENSAACSTYPLWQGLDETVRNYLAGFTLVDVLHMKK